MGFRVQYVVGPSRPAERPNMTLWAVLHGVTLELNSLSV